MRTDPLNGRRLDSWKEIATYLARHERTVVRWEKKKGLPVHRVPGGERQSVFAYTAELDAWLRREGSVQLASVPQGLKPTSLGTSGDTAEAVPFPKSLFQIDFGNRKLRYYALAGVVTVSISLFALFGLRSRAGGPSFPARVGFTLNSMQVFDDKNQLLWTHTFPGFLGTPPLNDGRPVADIWRIADIRGREDREVLVAVALRSGTEEAFVGMEVDCLSSRGQLLWSYTPRERFQFGKYDIQGPWVPTDILISSHAGRTQVWLAFMHHLWGNSFVVDLDPFTGEETLRFVNTGSIRTLNELVTPHGNFLLAGGFNNEYDSGSLAVLDEAKAFAVSPQTEGTRHKCGNCPQGNPDQYFVFPRSEINQLEQFYEDRVFWLRVTGDQIEVYKAEKVNKPDGSDGVGTIYSLRGDSVVRPVAVRFDSGYDMLHRKLEKEGKLDHTLESCPERLHPRPIRMWMPAGGWTEIRLDPSGASE